MYEIANRKIKEAMTVADSRIGTGVCCRCSICVYLWNKGHVRILGKDGIAA